jgi:hypothetical protein
VTFPFHNNIEREFVAMPTYPRPNKMAEKPLKQMIPVATA